MSHQKTFENRKLDKAEMFLQENADSFEERICFLEMSAATKSGADIDCYWSQQHIQGIKVPENIIQQFIQIIESCGIPFPIAISSLARKPLTIEQQKKDGVFYTDFRLARLITNSCIENIKQNTSIVDFAAGTCILLLDVALCYQKFFPKQYDSWLQKNVFAFDLSEDALRGGAAAFLSTTSNANAVVSMVKKWKVCDSLLDNDISKMKFDIVVGNPPWGRIKLTRHNFATRTLMRWVSEGKDLGNLIPYLSTYMGHASFSSTFYYIHLLPEKLAAMDFMKSAGIIPEVPNED